MAKAAKLLAAGEQELFNTQHYQPIKRKLRAKTVVADIIHMYICYCCFRFFI